MFGNKFRVQYDLFGVVLLHYTCKNAVKVTLEWEILVLDSHEPVLKLTTISIRNIVSDKQLKAIQRVLKSSLKKLMATGKMIKLATRRSNMHKSQ